MIELRDVYKKLGSRQILSGMTLRVPKGMNFVLMGPSGSGKSVTLKHVIGILRPDAGSVTVDGQEVSTMDRTQLMTLRKRMGYLFQNGALINWLTVADNVGFGLRSAPRGARLRRTREVLERLGLAGLEQRYPRELSGGQRQRVALGRALAIEPALLLLDEPLSALDAPLRRTLRDDLRDVLRQFSIAAVVVTHDFTEAYRLADRIVVYEAGRVVQSAPRAELLWRPASEAVARIVGIRNVLQGTVLKATPDRIQFHWRGQTLEAVNSPSHSYLPAPGAPLAFFIRPEYVRLIRKDRGPADPRHHMNLMTGTIVGDEDFGTTWTLRIRLDGRIVAARDPTAPSRP